MLPPRLTIEEVLGTGPFTVALGRLGVLRTEQLLTLRERVIERLPEDFQLDAAALGQVQVLLQTPMPSIARMPRRKPAPGPCPLSPNIIADFIQVSAPLLDTSRYAGQLEVWVRSRLQIGLHGICRRLEPVLAEVAEAYQNPEIHAAMAGVCFTTDELSGMFRTSPPFPAPPLPGYFAFEPSLVAPLLESPICANFFTAAVQPAEAQTPRALQTAHLTAFWPSVIPARTLPSLQVLRSFAATFSQFPKWLEQDTFGFGFFCTALSTILTTCGSLWGVPTLIGSGLRLGIWGMARIVDATVRDPRDRFNPPQVSDIFRAIHRYHIVLARPDLVTARQ